MIMKLSAASFCLLVFIETARVFNFHVPLFPYYLITLYNYAVM